MSWSFTLDLKGLLASKFVECWKSSKHVKGANDHHSITKSVQNWCLKFFRWNEASVTHATLLGIVIIVHLVVITKSLQNWSLSGVTGVVWHTSRWRLVITLWPLTLTPACANCCRDHCLVQNRPFCDEPFFQDVSESLELIIMNGGSKKEIAFSHLCNCIALHCIAGSFTIAIALHCRSCILSCILMNFALWVFRCDGISQVGEWLSGWVIHNFRFLR